MLFLTLPNGVESGSVRINGQPAEAKVDRSARTLAFRYLPEGGAAPGPWDTRQIVEEMSVGNGLTNYCCPNAVEG